MTEENSFRFAEYAKPVAKHGKVKKQRLLLISLYILAAAAYAITAVVYTLPQLIAILPLLLWILIYFTWGTVSYEYCVRIASGKVSFLQIRGKKEKECLSLDLKEILWAKPYDDTMRGHDCRLLDFRADMREAGYALLYTEDGKETLVRFEATVSVVTAMRYYNKDVVVDKTALRI